jgi:hypothetical protein
MLPAWVGDGDANSITSVNTPAIIASSDCSGQRYRSLIQGQHDQARRSAEYRLEI